MQRTLPPKLKTFLNDKAQPYPVSPVDCLIRLALSCVLIKETSPNDGPLIVLFQSTIGKAEKEPWCMGFVQSLVAFVEGCYGRKSDLFPGEHCLTVFRASKSIVVSDPKPGDLIVYRQKGGVSGHVELIVKVLPNKAGFETVGGNTSDGTGINREGDGVYIKHRPFGGLGKMQLLGFLRPFTID